MEAGDGHLGLRRQAAGKVEVRAASDVDLAFIRRLPALTEVQVAGRHYIQEDSPDEIGRAIAGWMLKL